MRSVDTEALKNFVRKDARLAAEGETIVIGHRDVVVPDLRAARSALGESVTDALLADLVRRELATPALLSKCEALERFDPGQSGTLEELMVELALDRGER